MRTRSATPSTALDELAKPFIERVMNRAMTQALAGHSVEQA